MADFRYSLYSVLPSGHLRNEIWTPARGVACFRGSYAMGAAFFDAVMSDDERRERLSSGDILILLANA
jgi:hypothetical protein